MAEIQKQAAGTAEIDDNKPKRAIRCKLLHGAFKSQIEAIGQAVIIARKGFKGYVTIRNNRTYTIVLGEYETAKAADAAKKAAQKAGIKTEIEKKE